MNWVLPTIYGLWALLVFFYWVMASPESAPQQAALAGQTLVLAFIPYAIISVFQRSRRDDSSDQKRD